MKYDILGKLSVTVAIIIIIVILWILVTVIIAFCKDWIDDWIEKLPDWIRVLIAYSLIILILIFLAITIYNRL